MRVFLCLVGLCIALVGCSTPGKRARQHSAGFRQLSPSDQKLVLRGRVRTGLSQEGVYIAWGKPDEKRADGDGKDGLATETWVYRQRVTLLEPMNSYEFVGPYHGYNGPIAGRPLRPGFGVGGVGYEGSLELQPHVRSLDHLRLAVFSAGKVDRYKTAHQAWVAAAQPVLPPPAANLAPRPVVQGKLAPSKVRHAKSLTPVKASLHRSVKRSMSRPAKALAQKHGRKGIEHRMRRSHGYPARAKHGRTA